MTTLVGWKSESLRILLPFFLLAIGGDVCLAQINRSRPTPTINTIGEGVVWRLSKKKDLHGNALPPWNEVQITNIFGFKQAPNIGDKVTIIPIDADAPIIDLTIRKVQKRTECYQPDGEIWWEIELEPVTQQKYFETSGLPNRRDEAPFDVVIIYPAVKLARQLKQNELKRSMLPPRIALDTVKAAIDLTNDGLPDALLVEYCCLYLNRPAKECDLTCGKTFRKIRSRWKLVDTSGPC